MMFLLVGYLFLSFILVNSAKISLINNAILQPGYTSNNTLITNQTYNQCLCILLLSYQAANWFSNNTCQLFFNFPPTYKIKVTPGARLYFPQQSLPNSNQCCMPDINYLLNQLQQANMSYVNVANPRDLVVDNYGYLATIELVSSYLDRFDTTSLTRISQTIIQMSSSRTIGYNNGAYYVASDNNYMTIFDSGNLTALNNVTLTSVNGPRGIMFLGGGQTMVVSSVNNNYLVCFNRSNVLPIKYTFAYGQLVNCSGPHGLWRVNDSFFYATSYTTNSIYSYSMNNSNSLWKEQYVFSVPNLMSNTGPTHVTIDECNRFWFSLVTNITSIYDQQGNLLGNWTIANTQIFDIKIMDNYLMYISSTKTNQILRIDPNIQC